MPLPWKVVSLPLLRQSLCHRVVHAGLSVVDAAREAGVSRKTLYKYLKRYKANPLDSLADLSRRPHRSRRRVDDALEERVIQLRDQYGWGARKLHAVLRGQHPREPLCSARTITAILNRHQRIAGPTPVPGVDRSAVVRFEHDRPNALWQVDHKGPVEIARRKHHLWTMLDDHSRFCLGLEPMSYKSLAFTWPALWECFAEHGLPEAILADGAFADRGAGLSLWDVRLIRLGIRPIHGRPYHPQTQGKVERLHGTIARELLDDEFHRTRRDSMRHFLADRDRWRNIYNLMRPHEALDDQPPITRYVPSTRRRPDAIPEMHYASGAMTRRASQVGDITYHRTRIAVGRGLARELVELIERERDLEVRFGPHLVRVIPIESLAGRRLNERI